MKRRTLDPGQGLGIIQGEEQQVKTRGLKELRVGGIKENQGGCCLGEQSGGGDEVDQII